MHASVVVSISPSSSSLQPNQTEQFSFQISGSDGKTDQAVNWSATSGSINSSGLFTAPNVSEQTEVTITAIRQGHPHESATTQVTVSPAALIQHTVSLSWNVDSQAVSYSVYRGDSSTGPFALLASAISETSYTDATVVSGETYFYVVNCVNSAGQESSNSSAVEAVIP